MNRDVPPSSSLYTPAALARLGRLVRKEVLEILRDRRTILTLVLMPLLLYPLLTVAFQQFFLASRLDPSRGMEYQLGFPSEDERDLFLEFAKGARHLLEMHAPQPPRLDPRDAPQTKPEQDLARSQYPDFTSVIDPDVEGLVRKNLVDLAIRVRNADKVDLKRPGNVPLEWEAIYVPTSPGAQGALRYVDQLLAVRNFRYLEFVLKSNRVRPPLVFDVHKAPIRDAGAGSMISLAALVPLILILMTITGAVYPAIDLTAGERERGTLEILVAAPVPRMGLLFAKYVSVLTVATLTALVNLTTMTITLELSGLSRQVLGDTGFTPLLVLQVLGLLLLFASFFSAVLLSLTSFARSFKEAQAYLIPLMLLSLAPGIMGMIPGIKLEGLLALTPLINIVLLARDLFDATANPVTASVDAAMAVQVVASTLLYAVVAIAVAANVFGAESVLYSEQGSWGDLVRRPDKDQAAATVGGALTTLGLMIPVNFLFQGIVRMLVQDGILAREAIVYLVPLIGLVLFVGLPLIATTMRRVRLTTGWGLAWPPVAGVLGALCLGLSLWPAVLQMLLYLHDDNPLLREQTEPYLQALRQMPLVSALALAIVGIAEEAFFRGFLFSALERTSKPPVTIAVSAVIFGLMHGLLQGGLGIDQIVSATLLGLVLGVVRWSTGSVLPGMLLHATHNIILVVNPFAADWQSQVPPAWLAGSLAGAAFGLGLVILARKRT